MIGVRWSRESQTDLAQINDFHRQTHAGESGHAGELVIHAAQFLTQDPSAGQAIPETRVRKWRVARTPFILLYRPTAEHILIIRVVHAARAWQQFL